ncbi:TonB-dependent siderophore receptor [Sphingomonas sp.]|jgi:catecholate siderophore receptor|uniref:TonB-dependent receptor n=1 Tax=Sphingomonas sp. TaxID=28214 RepID=UPI002DE3BA93|nr:TonB-dependent siderophore receptor [Sphingomonas sp.]HEV2569397.1 TonB-dependent siderophore receptor [Sphingomonas sp.]
MSRFLLTTALSLVAAVPTLAQDAQPERKLGGVVVTDTAIDPLSIERPADRGYKADRIVSATRTDTPVVDVPQSVTVVTSEAIRDLAATSIGDAIRYVPGVTTAQGEGNRETIVFRGNASTADFFVDGLRDDIQTYRDVYNIERLEVLRGPNAMIFGRGGVGGVINRVTKQADWEQRLGGRLEIGNYDVYRGSVDMGTPLSDFAAVRLNAVYEDSNSFRRYWFNERWGVNPTAAFRLGEDTLLQLSYEHFEDERTSDRGVPAAGPVPAAGSAPIGPLRGVRRTFFGDPDNSTNFTNTDAVQLAAEHRFGEDLTLRHRTRYADHVKFYRNVFTSAVRNTNAGTVVDFQGYQVRTTRENLISQTDLNAEFATGGVRHTLLAGFEYNHQETDNLRLSTDFDSGAATVRTVTRPIGDPTFFRTDLVFSPVASDADNVGTLKGWAVYLQDQIEIAPWLQIVAGLRYDKIDLDFTDRRATATQRDYDFDQEIWSPRLGVIVKPAENASIYASYSRTALPRFGEQLASLSPSNANLAPEKFENLELGGKWDVTPDLNLSAAIFELKRKNVLIPDPANPTLSILADAQRTRGFELAVQGQVTPQLQVTGAYTYLDAEFTRATSATVPAGNRIANTPRHIASIFGRYDVTEDLGLGLGVVHQSARFANADNLVRLPGYTRVDGAIYYDVTPQVRVQANVENIFNKRYFVNAHTNNNIQPGAPTTLRAAVSFNF